jgi:tape measure domain-containing protein|nr:MAG TPA: minor tail protein [Caudoviricetes sp.]
MAEAFVLEGKVLLDAKKVINDLDKIDKKGKETGKSFDSLGDIATKVGNKMNKFAGKTLKVVGGALTGITSLVVGFGIKSNASLETSTTAWTTLLGTQERAKKMMDDITKYAATTPFSKAGVDAMAKQLHNAGYEGDKLFEQLTKFGNMGGAFGIQEDSLKEMVRQYSQVQMATVAYTEDLNILQDRGVPIYKALAEVTGKSVAEVKKMAGEGKISADIYNKAIDSIAKTTDGAMAKQSRTFSGMVSTLKDNLTTVSQKIVEPLFEKLIEVMPKIIDVIDKVTENLDKGLPLYESVKDAISSVFGEDTWNKINRVKNIVIAFVGAMALLKTVMAVSNFITSVSSAFNVLSGALQKSEFFTTLAAKAQMLLNGAWLSNPITWIIIGIGLLVGAIIILWNKSETFRQFVLNMWEQIKLKFQEFKDWLTGIFTVDWSNSFGMFGNVINAFLQNVKNVWDSIKRIFEGVIQFVKGAFTGDWSLAWEGVKNIFGGIMDGLGAVIKAPLNAVIGLINGAIQGINDAISFTVPDWIPGLGGKGFSVNIPKINYLENGGILTQPTMLNANVMAGEKNKGRQAQTEVVVPLDRLEQWIKWLASRPAILQTPDGKELMRFLAPHQNEFEEYNNRFAY